MYLKSIQGAKLHKTLAQIYLLCVHDNYPPHLHLFLHLGISTSFVFKLKGLLAAENTLETIPTIDNFLLPHSSGISHNSIGGIIDICSVNIYKQLMNERNNNCNTIHFTDLLQSKP